MGIRSPDYDNFMETPWYTEKQLRACVEYLREKLLHNYSTINSLNEKVARLEAEVNSERGANKILTNELEKCHDERNRD